MRPRCRPRLIAEERGLAALEFGLILPAFLLFIFIIMEGGRALNVWVTLTNDTREAARYGNNGCLTYWALQSSGSGTCPAPSGWSQTISAGDCSTVSCIDSYDESQIQSFALSFLGASLDTTGAATHAYVNQASMSCAASPATPPLTLCINILDNGSVPREVQVQANYTVTVITPLVAAIRSTVPVAAYAQMQIQ